MDSGDSAAETRLGGERRVGAFWQGRRTSSATRTPWIDARRELNWLVRSSTARRDQSLVHPIHRSAPNAPSPSDPLLTPPGSRTFWPPAWSPSQFGSSTPERGCKDGDRVGMWQPRLASYFGPVPLLHASRDCRPPAYCTVIHVRHASDSPADCLTVTNSCSITACSRQITSATLNLPTPSRSIADITTLEHIGPAPATPRLGAKPARHSVVKRSSGLELGRIPPRNTLRDSLGRNQAPIDERRRRGLMQESRGRTCCVVVGSFGVCHQGTKFPAILHQRLCAKDSIESPDPPSVKPQ